MAMTKPIALSQNAFDSTSSATFKFTTSGGNQVTKNKITIRLNSNNSVVYTNTLETFKFEQTVPANTLVNGNYYNVYFNTYDKNNNESANSNVISFYCYTRPTLTITNIPQNNIISSSSFNFEATYSQLEKELLYFYQFILYDSGGNVLSKSNELYNSNTPPFNIEYNIGGFKDDKNYSIEAIAYTVNGTYVTSGKSNFSVNYFYPSVYSILDLSNVRLDGYTEITNNMILIDGKSNPDPITYVDNSKVDLTTNGYYVKWNKGYVLKEDFVIQSFIHNPNVGENIKILTMKNLSIENEITLHLKQETYGANKNKYFLELKSFIGNIEYYTTSEYVDSIAHLTFWIKRIGNIYEVRLGELS